MTTWADVWLTGKSGAAGAAGAAGAPGADGKTVLNGSGAPSAGTGANGDFYIDTTANSIYGPKAGGVWGSGTSLVGPAGAPGSAGAAGTNGTNGTNGYSVLHDAGAPGSGVGVVNDFYIDTTANAIYGPKTSGGWGTGTSLVGPAGSNGSPDTAQQVLDKLVTVDGANSGLDADLLDGNHAAAFAVSAHTHTLPALRRVVSLTDQASVAVSADTTDVGLLTTVSQDITVGAPSGSPVDGQLLRLRFKSTSSRGITWNAIYRGSVDLALPTATTGSSKTDYFMFCYNSAESKWDYLARNMGF